MNPQSEAELAEAVRDAAGPLAIRGGGTRVSLGDGAMLDISGLNGIVHYEPGAMAVVVRAGTPLAELEAALAVEGQRLPFEPPDLRGLLGTEGTSTIGGVVAANASGPRRIQAGACRDSLIGVRFVDGTGAVVKNGGRVMKNVTGLDLVKLMAGSHGTLGVLSEVSLRVLPVPESGATLLLEGLSDARAVAALALALGSPFDVNGAAHVGGMTMLRVEGFAASVDYRVGQLRSLLGGFGPVKVQEGAGPWPGIRDVTVFQGRPGDVWRISVKPSDGPAIAARTRGEVSYDWGGGLVWALVPGGTDLRGLIGPFAGHATLVRASAGQAVRHARFNPESAPIAAISAGLRARFDPRGILNPGLMR